MDSNHSIKQNESIFNSFNKRLLFACSLIALSQVNFGLEQGVFGATQAMPFFTQKFGVYNTKTKTWAIQPYFLSFLNSFTYIGFAFGLVMGSFISRKFGRRWCMFSMCIWAIIGATILVTSQKKEQMLVGRIIAYIYIGMELAVVPVFQSELVPRRVRGFIVGTYQFGLFIGQLLGALICRGTSEIKSDSSWKIPLGLLYVIPIIVAGLVWFMQESPRWYLIKGRPEKSLEALRKLRIGRFTEPQILAEFEDLQQTIDLNVDQGKLFEIFKKSNLKRTLIVIGTNVFLQLTGQNFVSTYGTIYIASLGTVNPFSMQIVNVVTSMCFTVLTMFLTDKTGRRPLLIIGAVFQTIFLFTLGGLGTPAVPSFQIKQAITAMVTLFGCAFSFGWAPLSHVVAAEVPTSRLRDPTYALASIFNIAIQFAVTFSIPYLLYAPYANLGSKVGFIFGSCAILATIFSIFFIPECGGKSLEEIDRLFAENVPIRKFGKTRPVMAEPEAFEEKIRVQDKSVAEA